MFVRMCVPVFVCVCMYVCINIRLFVFVCVVCVYASCMCGCVSCMCMCMCVSEFMRICMFHYACIDIHVPSYLHSVNLRGGHDGEHTEETLRLSDQTPQAASHCHLKTAILRLPT